ncbi:uncharacterized protein LOC131614160 [Vicia villosa]|uniref:uncharacterized protein LOC131614160 n=1 Tax=Vicia villosa TaxID=3911 RepID=UPI00273AA2AA|nr:uncharacterized protein LOC131614160 [Vicia villosa]
MAAATATESVEPGDKVTLRVMVDKQKNEVVYAEAGKDFVEALLSFLTMPLDLDEQYLCSHICKEMLLNPMNSMGVYYEKVKLNIDDTPTRVFLCEDWICVRCMRCMRCMSIFSNPKCPCGKLLEISDGSLIAVENGFVMKGATFIIDDNLCLMPNDLGTSLCLLQKRGINGTADIEKKTILVGKKEVADLLKLSLLSKTPLTDFVLKNSQILCNSNPNSEIKLGKCLPSDSDEGKQMVVKVLRRKSNRKILFATAEEDFADFLFSFLTFPLGGVLHMLEGSSSLSCIDVLYRSIKELSPERCLTSKLLKDLLAKPPIFPKYDELRSQILPIGTIKLIYESDSDGMDSIEKKSPNSGGYATSPLTIMVTDDLVVTPMSSVDGVSYLERMNVPFNDVEELVIRIGLKEGLSILKASLTSTSALTNALNHYIDIYTIAYVHGRKLICWANLTSDNALTDRLYNLKKPKEEYEV